MTRLAAATLLLARKCVEQRVREHGGQNRGPEVKVYLWFVGLLEGNPWCVAWALYMVHQAAKRIGESSRLPKTGSSSRLYRWFKAEKLLLMAPTPGCIGMRRGGKTGHRHTFIVEKVLQNGMVAGLDGNWKDAVGRSEHPRAACDFGRIC